MKLLTKLINVPYHCSLYTFRCQTLDDLVRNEHHFKPHQIQKQQLTESGRWQGDALHRVASKISVFIQAMDIERMSQQWESDHARHPTYTSTVRPLHTEIVEIHVPPKEIEMITSTPPQTPSCSPSIQNLTPLSTPIRNILIKEAQDEAEEIALTPVVVPMESSPVVKHHPAVEWSMISVASPGKTGTCSMRTASSTASTSSCHTSIIFRLFTEALDEVKNMMAKQTKDFSKHMTEMYNVINRLTSQITGLRSVVKPGRRNQEIVLTTVVQSSVSHKPCKIQDTTPKQTDDISNRTLLDYYFSLVEFSQNLILAGPFFFREQCKKSFNNVSACFRAGVWYWYIHDDLVLVLTANYQISLHR
jgi:hypothetical protein